LPPLSLYIHVPWCIKKCPYCDFNSHAVKTELPEIAYVDALLTDFNTDIARFGLNRSLQSIFIGGGTPSLFSPEAFDRLLCGIRQHAELAENIEITLEANPGTFESAKFREFRALGINRLSIGIQSFDDRLLQRLGRVHSGKEAIKAAEIAQQAGFENFNLDLMFGLPDALPEDSKRDIATALALKPAHLSFYQLTLEPNTWFHKFPPRLPDDEDIYRTQLECQTIMAQAGFRQYEISAYSQPGQACRHNLNYWQFGDYVGIGAGAHGKITQALPDRIIRTSKTKSPELYQHDPSNQGASTAIPVTEIPLEYVMNQLRLKQGFTSDQFAQMTGLPLSALEPGLADCMAAGLLEKGGGYYACTATGWNFLDTVLQHFMS
jgi:putative oxygen-independent coproporphyrinogen III oxidase